MKIYVSGPLNADVPNYIFNLQRMIRVSIALIRKGHHPYVPGLDFLIGLLAMPSLTYNDYLNLNMVWLESSDAIYVIAPSPGVNKELALALKLGLKIFRSLEEVPEVVE